MYLPLIIFMQAENKPLTLTYGGFFVVSSVFVPSIVVFFSVNVFSS